MSINIPPSFISAWFDRSVELKFDCSKQRLEALQKAAGRIIGEASCQIIRSGDQFICYLVKRDPNMYKSVPFYGLTIVKPLPPRDSEIGDRFLALVAEENSQTPSQTPSRSGDDISPLGIVETLLAISASLLLAVYLNDFTHIVVGTVLAPLFLLRTNDVNDRILRVADKYLRWINDFTFNWNEALRHSYELTKEGATSWGRVRRLIVFMKVGVMGLSDMILKTIGILVGFQLIKLTLTAQYVICHPLLSLSVVPTNWRRIALSANCRQTPEVLPGIEDADVAKYHFGWWRISSLDEVMFSIPEYERPDRANLFFLWIWIPAFIAKLFFKSTTLFWSPLLWVAYPLHQTANIIASMRRMCDGAVYKVQRWYSFLIIAAFAAKILIFSAIVNRLEAISWQPLKEILWSLIVPDGIPPWQIAGVINAVITLVIYFVADYYVREFAEMNTMPGRKVKQAYQTALTVRNLLSIYIVICTGYILVQVGATVHWPPLQNRVFPWN